MKIVNQLSHNNASDLEVIFSCFQMFEDSFKTKLYVRLNTYYHEFGVFHINLYKIQPRLLYQQFQPEKSKFAIIYVEITLCVELLFLS